MQSLVDPARPQSDLQTDLYHMQVGYELVEAEIAGARGGNVDIGIEAEPLLEQAIEAYR
jgi:hypothetical protein